MAAEQGIRVRFSGDASGFDAAAKKVTTSLTQVSRSTGQATTTLTNFSRIVQDAPFGIIGIANNIDPLIQSFQQLRRESGSTGTALKSLASGLIGGGGLALAVSAVTSALAYFSLRSRSAKEELTGLAKVQEEAAKHAGEELSRLQLLTSIATDKAVSDQKRALAVQELQEKYPEYLKNVSKEAILNGQAADAINQTTQAIINKSLALAAQEEIARIGAEVFKNERALAQETERVSFLQKEYNKAVSAGVRSNVQGTAATNSNVLQYSTLLKQASGNVDELKKKNTDLRNEQLKTIDLAKKFATQAGNTFFEVKPPPKIRPDKIPEIEAPEAKIRAARIAVIANELDLETIDTSKIKLPEFPSIKLPEPDPEQIERIKGYFSSIRELAAGVAEAVTTQLGGAFTGLFSDIMSGSQTAFQAFGQALANIIKRLIATAAAAAVLSVILGPLGLVKGAGGQALKGFDVFKSLFGKLGGFGFAEGGVASGPKSGYLATLHGKEVITPYDKFLDLVQDGGRQVVVVEGRISGNDILFISKRAERNRNITG